MLVIKKNFAINADEAHEGGFSVDGTIMSMNDIQDNYITNGDFGYAEMLTTLEVNPALKARRNAWEGNVYVYISGQTINMHTKDNSILEQWLASNEDIFSKDWFLF